MANTDDIPEISLQQVDVVLRFLPIFEQPGYVFGEWHSPEGQMPFYSMSREAADFVQALYDQQIIFPFDWTSWQDEAVRYITDLEMIKTADLVTCRKLLTTHVRQDRFVEGHLANMLESGHITAVLKRLQEIRSPMEMRRNEHELPFLDRMLLGIVFDGVYEHRAAHFDDEPVRDFLHVLYTMQDYNYRYRPRACFKLLPLFDKTIGRAKPDSKDTKMWLALGLAIKELYGMRSSTLKELLDLLPPPKSEDDILIACALRFHGYNYQDTHPFDHQRALDHFITDNEWDISQTEQLAVFFLLQRFLYKWGGEQLPKNSREWKAFRSLFLITHAYDIPAEYRHQDYYTSWERDYQPYQNAYVARVRHIHETTDYQQA